MKSYYRPEKFFTEKNTLEEIQNQLDKMPKKGDDNFDREQEKELWCGVWYTEHGFFIGSGCYDFVNGSSEAEGIYSHFHLKWGGQVVKDKYKKTEDWFTKESTIPEIREKLKTIPLFEGEVPISSGAYVSAHGFTLSSANFGDEADGIYQSIHWGDSL